MTEALSPGGIFYICDEHVLESPYCFNVFATGSLLKHATAKENRILCQAAEPYIFDVRQMKLLMADRASRITILGAGFIFCEGCGTKRHFAIASVKALRVDEFVYLLRKMQVLIVSNHIMRCTSCYD